MFLQLGAFDQSTGFKAFCLMSASIVYSYGWIRSYFCAPETSFASISSFDA
jgi:hypothetical protein